MTFKNSVSSIKKHKPSRRTLLIIAGIVAFVLLFLFGMVTQVRQENHDRAISAAQTAEYNDLKAKNPQLQAQVTELKNKLAATTAEKQVLCTQVKGYTQARATRTLVVVPVQANCPQ